MDLGASGLSVGLSMADVAAAEGTRLRARSIKDVVAGLEDYSKGKRSALQARRKFVRNVIIASTTASWCVFLSLPIICWASYGWLPKEIPFDYWGSMLLQFLFSVYVDLGSTVKLSVQGVAGTLIAALNMLFLNVVLKHWLGGGAYADHIWGIAKYNSRWLPLCHDGQFPPEELVHNSSMAGCLFNVSWSQVTGRGLGKFLLVMLNYCGFNSAMLYFGFDSNTRMFALSNAAYFTMSFLNPNTDSYVREPSVSSISVFVVLIGSFAAVLCLVFPRLLLAKRVACVSGLEATQAVGILLESMPDATSSMVRQKAISVSEQSVVILADFEERLANAWFEDFGLKSFGAARRRRLRSLGRLLRTALSHVRSVHHIASELTSRDLELLSELEPLREACAALRDAHVACYWEIAGGYMKGRGLNFRDVERGTGLYRPSSDFQGPIADVRSNLHTITAQLPQLRQSLSPEGHAFIFAVCGAVAEAATDLEHLVSSSDVAGQLRLEYEAQLQARSRVQAMQSMMRAVSEHFGVRVFERAASNPRFVLRNSLALYVAFIVGLLGVPLIFPAYNSTPASTVAVVIYTFTGTSAPITLKRLSGVVLGNVAGIVLQLRFAVQTVWFSIAYGFSMWFIVAGSFFIYLHSKEGSYVASLLGAYAAKTMIPSSGTFRQDQGYLGNDAATRTLIPDLFRTITSSIAGIIILLVFDVLLADRATTVARARLQRLVHRARAYAVESMTVGESRRGFDGAWKEGRHIFHIIQGTKVLEADGQMSTLRIDSAQECTFMFGTSHVKGLLSSDGKELELSHGTKWIHDLELGGEVFSKELDALEDVIPYAKQEPSYWWAPFKADLYVRLIAHLRAVQHFLAAIHWGLTLHDSRPVTPKLAPVFKKHGDLFSEIRGEVVVSLRQVEELAASITRDNHSEEDDKEVRRLIQEKLYGARVAINVFDSSQEAWLGLQKRLRRRRRPSSESSTAQAAAASSAGTASATVAPIEDYEITGVASSGSLPQAPGDIEVLLARLRATARAQEVEAADLPHEDDLCRVELVALLVKSMLLELRRMELTLLEY